MISRIEKTPDPFNSVLGAAPRFSPTRFIPPVAPAAISLELDCFQPLGIKRYTLRIRFPAIKIDLWTTMMP